MSEASDASQRAAGVPADAADAASDVLEPRTSGRGPVQWLDPNLIIVNRRVNAVIGMIVATVHLTAAAVLWLTSAWPRPALALLAMSWVPLAGGLSWLALRWPQLDYRHRWYRVDEDAIEIGSGVLWRETVAVPRSRVQHIDVSQGPLDRAYHLATLSIYTAGTHYSRVDLRGLRYSVALELRDALLPRDDGPVV